MAGRWWRSRFGGALVRELALVVALLLAYKYGRFLTRGHVTTALHNARGVVDLERSLGVFTEARLQDLVVSSTALVRFLNAYYLVAHVVATAAAFVWLYVRHPAGYRRFRNVMVVITVVGMSVHLLFPLAPPRMLPRFGFVDTTAHLRARVLRCREPLQGLRQPVRGDAVVALRVGAGDRVGGGHGLVEPLVLPGARTSRAHPRRHRPHRQPLLARRGRGDVPARLRARRRPAHRSAASAPGGSRGSVASGAAPGQTGATDSSAARSELGIATESCVPGITDTYVTVPRLAAEPLLVAV